MINKMLIFYNSLEVYVSCSAVHIWTRILNVPQWFCCVPLSICSLLSIYFDPFSAFTVLLACLFVISCFLNVYYFWPLTLSHFLPLLSDLFLNSFCCNWKWCSHQPLVQPLSWISADQACFSVWYSFMGCVPEYNVYCSLLLHPDHARSIPWWLWDFQ